MLDSRNHRHTMRAGMGMRLSGLLGFALCVLVAVSSSALAAGTAAPPDGPDLSTMALSPSDFTSGGAASGGRWTTSGSIPVYVVQNGKARIRSTSVSFTINLLLAQADAVGASGDIAGTRKLLSTPAGRAAFVKAFVKLPSTGGKKMTVVVGAPRAIAAGDEAFQFALTYVTGKKQQPALAEFVRVDRVEAFVLAMASTDGGSLPAAVGMSEALALATRMRAGLAVGAVTAPAVTGSPQQGQTLSADHGHWTGGPSAFAYQWNRCDAAGANCNAIAGATQASYVPAAADSGSTLTVTVTGSNTIGQMSSSSTPTAPIT
jgi:hypothetical protein